jgi:hypothetical protein
MKENKEYERKVRSIISEYKNDKKVTAFNDYPSSAFTPNGWLLFFLILFIVGLIVLAFNLWTQLSQTSYQLILCKNPNLTLNFTTPLKIPPASVVPSTISSSPSRISQTFNIPAELKSNLFKGTLV